MKRLSGRIGWALLGAVALAGVATLARVIEAGPLDPPGPVGSTMRTLGDLVPSWDQTLTSNGCGSARWSCVMGNVAVLDNETGIVWERTPSNAPALDWFTAIQVCDQTQTGARMGWRLPTAEELLSVHDPSSYQLPANSPFTGVDGNSFWSSTSAPGNESSARYIGFNFASASVIDDKRDTTFAGAWCVRGGGGHDFAAQDDGSWSKSLPANSGGGGCTSARFECSGSAVLDHTTHLVWTKSTADALSVVASQGAGVCYRLSAGGVSGWRLPTEPELLTLLDVSNVNPALSLPNGHPFTNVPNLPYPWLSSTFDGTLYWGVNFMGGSPGQPGQAFATTSTSYLWNVWCVRAPE